MINWIKETIAFLKTKTSQLHSILQSLQKVKIFVMTSEEMRLKFKKTKDA